MNNLSAPLLALAIALPLSFFAPASQAAPDLEMLRVLRTLIAQAEAELKRANPDQLQDLSRKVESIGQNLEQHWKLLRVEHPGLSTIEFLSLETALEYQDAMSIILHRLTELAKEHLNNQGLQREVDRALKIWTISQNACEKSQTPQSLHTIFQQFERLQDSLSRIIRICRNAQIVDHRIDTFEDERDMLYTNLGNLERVIQAIEDFFAPPLPPRYPAAAAAAAADPSPTPTPSAAPSTRAPACSDDLLEGLDAVIPVLAIVLLGYSL